jgi:predicted RNA binding protein YcfA (HicA-like mRNA interferase family)
MGEQLERTDPNNGNANGLHHLQRLGMHQEREVVSRLKQLGFTDATQRGNRMFLRHEDGKRHATVSWHSSGKGEIAGNLVRHILRQSGTSEEEFKSKG